MQAKKNHDKLRRSLRAKGIQNEFWMELFINISSNYVTGCGTDD